MVWTYLGRTSCDTGILPEARRALERTLVRNDMDYFAPTNRHAGHEVRNA